MWAQDVLPGSYLHAHSRFLWPALSSSKSLDTSLEIQGWSKLSM